MESGVGERRERKRKGGEKRENVSEQVIMGFGPREVWLTVLAVPLIFTRLLPRAYFSTLRLSDFIGKMTVILISASINCSEFSMRCII